MTSIYPGFYPDFSMKLAKKVGESRDWPRLSSNCLGNFESRGGLPDLDLDFSKSRGGLPDLDLDSTRPDFCRDIIPLEISRTWLVPSYFSLGGLA